MSLYTVQLIFYSLGSLLFIVMLLVVIGMIITFFVIRRKLTTVSNQVNEKISLVKDIYDHKEKYALQAISKGSSKFLENIVSLFIKKRK